MYKITEYSYNKAKSLGVDIKPSENPNKKIDVFKNNKKIATIGDINSKDYPTYVKEKGLDYANIRRKLYKLRHAKDIHKGNGFWASALLW